jgi:hypothetical protein
VGDCSAGARCQRSAVDVAWRSPAVVLSRQQRARARRLRACGVEAVRHTRCCGAGVRSGSRVPTAACGMAQQRETSAARPRLRTRQQARAACCRPVGALWCVSSAPPPRPPGSTCVLSSHPSALDCPGRGLFSPRTAARLPSRWHRARGCRAALQPPEGWLAPRSEVGCILLRQHTRCAPRERLLRRGAGTRHGQRRRRWPVRAPASALRRTPRLPALKAPLCVPPPSPAALS